jgi:beta-glucosidase
VEKALKTNSSAFPPGFLWGAATAAHQVEGGNRWNDWWEQEEAGRLPYRSGEACDHYRRFEADFELAASMGHTCHRLSLEWSRIEPHEGRFDEAALEHYASVLEALKSRGIEPVVTLHHFTLPAWLAARGGWLAADSVERFARYVGLVADRYGGDVRFWLTVNEPTVYILQGYVNGIWPPYRTGHWSGAWRVLRRLARAHRVAYRRIKQRHPGALVAFAHSATWMEPCDPGGRLDRVAAWLRDAVFNGLVLRLFGAPWRRSAATGTLDFVGLNYYTRCCVKFAGRMPAALLGKACHLPHHANAGRISDVGWEVYPRGFGKVLAKFARLGLPLFVTENGIATRDDSERCRFIEEHLAVLSEAVRAGLPVLGYLHWSLMDNFEWHCGTAPRFGLLAVDYATQAREPRPSARRLSEICGGLDA